METTQLTVGESAPDFTVIGTEGEQQFQTYTLSDYLDSGPVILVFYPFDFSPVCTTELCEFRDAEWLTMTENVDVFAISRDSCYAHSRFIDEYDLGFPLLSDIEGTVIEQFGVKYGEWDGHQGVAKRAVFLIDANGNVQYAWGTDNAYENPDIREIASELTDLPSVQMEDE